MNQPEVSIIVPVYNAEEYLDKCIQSILKQTYANFELLIINDGSTDSSGSICDKYALQDKRIDVIHKDNNGVSSARNTGIDRAKGRYICFIDSDDWVEEGYIEGFNIDHTSSEVILYLQGHKDQIENHLLVNQERSFVKDEIIRHNNINEFIQRVRLFHNGYPFCKVYSNLILKSKEIRFKEGIQLNEDLIFNYEYFLYIDSIQVSKETGYIYMHQNNASLSKQKLSFEEYDLLLSELYKKTSELLLKYNISKSYKYEVLNIVVNRFIRSIRSMYSTPSNLNRKYRLKVLKYYLSKYALVTKVGGIKGASNLILKTRLPFLIDLYMTLRSRLAEYKNKKRSVNK